jgi:hypothetical protein
VAAKERHGRQLGDNSQQGRHERMLGQIYVVGLDQVECAFFVSGSKLRGRPLFGGGDVRRTIAPAPVKFGDAFGPVALATESKKFCD